MCHLRTSSWFTCGRSGARPPARGCCRPLDSGLSRHSGVGSGRVRCGCTVTLGVPCPTTAGGLSALLAPLPTPTLPGPRDQVPRRCGPGALVAEQLRAPRASPNQAGTPAPTLVRDPITHLASSLLSHLRWCHQKEACDLTSKAQAQSQRSTLVQITRNVLNCENGVSACEHL